MQRTRRNLLKNAATAAAGATLLASELPAQTQTPEKRAASGKPGPFPFTPVVGFGNLLFVSGIGCRVKGTIEEETKWVLDELEKNLTAAGSSLSKVLKMEVYLEDIKDFDRMNAVYKTRNWGPIFPARNTTQPAALPTGDYGIVIDCIAST